jgi:hypothetical protein
MWQTATLKNDCPKERYGERSPHRTIIQTNDMRSGYDTLKNDERSKRTITGLAKADPKEQRSQGTIAPKIILAKNHPKERRSQGTMAPKNDPFPLKGAALR